MRGIAAVDGRRQRDWAMLPRKLRAPARGVRHRS